MKIRIDKQRCSGHGQCYSVAPTLFEDDEAGYGQVKGDGTLVQNAQDTQDDEERLKQAEAAVIACPEQAIAIDRSA